MKGNEKHNPELAGYQKRQSPIELPFPELRRSAALGATHGLCVGGEKTNDNNKETKTRNRNELMEAQPESRVASAGVAMRAERSRRRPNQWPEMAVAPMAVFMLGRKSGGRKEHGWRC